METLEERLCKSVVKGDREAVAQLLSEGANPNKISKYGKSGLGIAAYVGNLYFVKLFIDTTKSSKTPSKTRQLSNKRKISHDGQNNESTGKCKSRHDRTFKEGTGETTHDNREKNQGYFVFTYSECSSGDEGRLTGLKQPVSSPSLPSSPQADLEWDEEIGNVAPTTKEDEKWTSLYQWYARILENTGVALETASSVTNGIDQQDGHGNTALHWAAQQGHVEVVKLLVNAGCKLDLPSRHGFTPLFEAVTSNYPEIAEILIKAGSQVNYKNYEKMTALHYAASASRGFLDVVQTLVRCNANIEARNSNERTPLYLAAGRGNLEVVQYLIRAGASVNSEEIHGYTPLCEAVWQGYVDVVKTLLASGARIIHTHKLLHYCIIHGNEEMVRVLANHSSGSGINLRNVSGETPLLLAVRSSRIDYVHVLLENGANVNLCNSITGDHILHVAVECIACPKVFEKLLTTLLDYKIDMNEVSLSGDTALNRAILYSKNDDAAWLLIRHGADVNSCNLDLFGTDNLSGASKRNTRRLANMLLKAGHRPIRPDLPKKRFTANWVYVACKHPLSLSDLCRIKIRNIGTQKILYRFVEALPLPRSIKSYLMMEEYGTYYTG